MEKVSNFLELTAHNKIIQIVAIAIVCDTIFGVLRAVKEHKFNSSAGIDGAIRKISMVFSLAFMLMVDTIVHINLIGFIPESVRNTFGLSTVGIAEFFAILYISYEIVSILKNMTLCGLPVKKLWESIRCALSKYTDELPTIETEETNDK